MNEFENAVEKLQEQLIGIPEDQRHEWLRILHTNYTQRFTTDNERIWSTGAIMVPLSLSGFAIFTSIDRASLAHSIVIGLASILLMLAWIFIAENHRAFQDKSLAWICAIEKEAGIMESIDSKLETNPFTKIFTFQGATQVIRVILLMFTIISWLIVWVVWPY